MQGVWFVAIAAAIGNFLQGWDNAAIAGAVLYVKKEFNLEDKPFIEGLIVAMSLIGATIITTCSGVISDWLGRRPMLIASSVLYFVSGLVMIWSPNVYVLLVARLIDGFGIGLSVTFVPVYISETAPPEIRGSLNTLPQFTGSIGMFLSYCMIFGMSLMASPSWRLMLGVLSIPALLFFILTVFFVPESPRWLVSKGKMLEAKMILQNLRGKEDVSGELALLVEGLGINGETSVEEYIIGPPTDFDNQDTGADKDQIRICGPEQGLSRVAKPVTWQSSLSLLFRHGNMERPSVPLMDPLVTLFGSFHEKLPEQGSMCSMVLPNFGSMLSATEDHDKHEQWDEKALQMGGENDISDAAGCSSDDNLQSPLLSRQTSIEKDSAQPVFRGSTFSMRSRGSLMQGNGGDSAMAIGGGWQLAWRWFEREDGHGKKEEGFKRVYLHEEGVPGSRKESLTSLPAVAILPEGEFTQAAALVSQSALYPKEFFTDNPAEESVVHPSEAAKGPRWADLLEPGVKLALFVGVGLQMLQQFSGINGVMYYTPQILEEAGVHVLLANLGLSLDSASLLVSACTTFLMLPCIFIGMWLMDIAGRRRLLLTTIPVLIVSLAILVIGYIVNISTAAHAIISTICVILYFCVFVSAFGPIPNILCSEIFPTRVRGLCIAICAFAYWICDIIVTYTISELLTSIGLAGVFGIYAIMCIISWVFIYLRVPETKGIPLEVITNFFVVGSKPPSRGERLV